MVQALWSHLFTRSGLLPARDIFDIDLDRARERPGCALCHLVQDHDQQVMRSLLWEYCTDPHMSERISRYWGFCPYHAWSLAALEQSWLGDCLGVSLVHQTLLRQVHASLQQQLKDRSWILTLPVGPDSGNAHCQFCQHTQQVESWFLARLTTRAQQVSTGATGENEPALQTALCFPHIRRLLQPLQENRLWRSIEERQTLTHSAHR